MIVYRIIAAAVLAAALGACQQADSAKRTKPATAKVQPSEPEEYVSTGVFKAREEKLQFRFAERLLKSCMSSFGSDGEMRSCYRERVLHAFDGSGLAGQHCPVQEDLEGEVSCIIGGSIGYHFVQTVAKDKIDEFNWSDPESSINAVTMEFILAELQRCLGGSSASSPDECLKKAFVTQLEIPDADAQMCLKLEDDYKQGQCLGEAYALKFMAAGIEKV